MSFNLETFTKHFLKKESNLLLKPQAAQYLSIEHDEEQVMKAEI